MPCLLTHFSIIATVSLDSMESVFEGTGRHRKNRPKTIQGPILNSPKMEISIGSGIIAIQRYSPKKCITLYV